MAYLKLLKSRTRNLIRDHQTDLYLYCHTYVAWLIFIPHISSLWKLGHGLGSLSDLQCLAWFILSGCVGQTKGSYQDKVIREFKN